MNVRKPASYVVVTGAGSGLGQALVEALHRQRVPLVAFSGGTPVEKDKPVGDRPGDVPLRRECGNLADMATVSPVLERLVTEWGPPALVVHNAAVLHYRGPLWQEPEGSVRETLLVNLVAPMLWVSRLVPSMLQAGRGGHLFLSSSVGRQPRADWGTYAVSKRALEAFSDNLALELPEPLFCLTLNPGPVATETRRKAYPEEDPSSPRPASVAAGIVSGFLPVLLGPEARQFNGKKLDLEKIKDMH